jgi:ATP-dependent DNA ligase
MLATVAASLPTGSSWTYEVKWDGYRTIAVKDTQWPAHSSLLL